MRIEHFRYCFSRLNGFYLKEHLIMFRKPLELWNEQTGESNTFKTIEDALKYKIDGETIEDIILSTDTLYIPPINGGRGSSGESKTFKFSHAKGDGRGDKSRGLLPAYANTRIKTKNIETAMRDFRKNHVDSDHEWAYEVDGQGYVHQYVEGNKSSVRIGSRGRNTQTVELFQMQTLSAQLWTGNQVPSWQVGKSMTIFSKKERISRAIHSLKQ